MYGGGNYDHCQVLRACKLELFPLKKGADNSWTKLNSSINSQTRNYYKGFRCFEF